jgi:hypothetical protein
MLGGEVEELGDGGCLMINLLREEPLSALYAPTQVPSILGPLVRMSLRASVLHSAGLRLMDSCRSSKKAGVCSNAESSGLTM